MDLNQILRWWRDHPDWAIGSLLGLAAVVLLLDGSEGAGPTVDVWPILTTAEKRRVRKRYKKLNAG